MSKNHYRRKWCINVDIKRSLFSDNILRWWVRHTSDWHVGQFYSFILENAVNYPFYPVLMAIQSCTILNYESGVW